jgi:hypothetical protein
MRFLSCGADICIYGGAAGGGKTYSLLLEPLRHISNSKFGATVFRKNDNQIIVEGGLLDESKELYADIRGARLVLTSPKRWIFQSGAKITFAHIERDEDLSKWQGSQITEIAFDELTHFTEKQFFYMLSRNRSMCGVKPYVRATYNPDTDSWAAKFIEWWIDQDTGYAIEKRCGKIRWFIRRDDKIYRADKKEQLWEQFNLVTDDEKQKPRSVSFINSTLQDNKLLMEQDPSYVSNLEALPTVERERLLMGNRKIKPSAGLYFKRTQIGDILQFVPEDVVRWVRGWDLAATADSEGGEPAYTAGVLIGKRKNGRYVVADVINVRQRRMMSGKQ